MWARGEVTAMTYCWKPGFDGWKRLAAVAELRRPGDAVQILAAPNPVVPAPPPEAQPLFQAARSARTSGASPRVLGLSLLGAVALGAWALVGTRTPKPAVALTTSPRHAPAVSPATVPTMPQETVGPSPSPFVSMAAVEFPSLFPAMRAPPPRRRATLRALNASMATPVLALASFRPLFTEAAQLHQPTAFPAAPLLGSVQTSSAESDAAPSDSPPGLLERVRAHRRAIEACVEAQHARQPEARGTLVMQWIMTPTGATQGVAAKHPDDRSASFADCLTTEISAWKFEVSGPSSTAPVQFAFRY